MTPTLIINRAALKGFKKDKKDKSFLKITPIITINKTEIKNKRIY